MSIAPQLEPLIQKSRAGFRVLSDAEREASLQSTLAQHDPERDVWVFGYGSLVWRPSFPFSESRSALVRGYHRSLCLWSRVNRGTPERPGLVFGLDSGGSCRGIAYRLHSDGLESHLRALWQREMPSGAYQPKWLACQTPDGPVRALTFTVDRRTPAYVSNLSDEQLVWIIEGAHGSYGPCSEYVLETARALQTARIQDRRLARLVSQLIQEASD